MVTVYAPAALRDAWHARPGTGCAHPGRHRPRRPHSVAAHRMAGSRRWHRAASRLGAPSSTPATYSTRPRGGQPGGITAPCG